MLLDEVRQHAIPSWELQAFDDPAQQLFELDDGVEVVGRGVYAEDHVAAAVRESLEG